MPQYIIRGIPSPPYVNATQPFEYALRGAIYLNDTTPTVASWFQPFSTPLPAPGFSAAQQQFLAFVALVAAAPVVVTTVDLAHFPDLFPPRSTAALMASGGVMPPQPGTPSMGWYEPWERPPLRAGIATALMASGATVPPEPAPVVPSWLTAFSQPLPRQQLPISDYFFPVVNPPTPSPGTPFLQTYFVANNQRLMNRRGG